MQASAATAEALFSPITVSSQKTWETGQSPAPKWRFRFCFKLSPWQSTIMNGTFDWTSRSDNEWMIVLMIRLRWSSNQSCRKRPSARSIACSGSQVPTRVHTVVDVASTTDYCTSIIGKKYINTAIIYSYKRRTLKTKIDVAGEHLLIESKIESILLHKTKQSCRLIGKRSRVAQMFA